MYIYVLDLNLPIVICVFEIDRILKDRTYKYKGPRRGKTTKQQFSLKSIFLLDIGVDNLIVSYYTKGIKGRGGPLPKEIDFYQEREPEHKYK